MAAADAEGVQIADPADIRTRTTSTPAAMIRRGPYLPAHGPRDHLTQWVHVLLRVRRRTASRTPRCKRLDSERRKAWHGSVCFGWRPLFGRALNV